MPTDRIGLLLEYFWPSWQNQYLRSELTPVRINDLIDWGPVSILTNNYKIKKKNYKTETDEYKKFITKIEILINSSSQHILGYKRLFSKQIHFLLYFTHIPLW